MANAGENDALASAPYSLTYILVLLPTGKHMIEKSRLQGSPANQPNPQEFGFDLDRTLTSIVTLRSVIPDDAFTAAILGTKRAGSGIVIRESGLVLTIGYLITEAESVWLVGADGKVTPAHVVGYDQESGFGLVQALGRLGLPALDLGRTSEAMLGDRATVAGAGGRNQCVRAQIIAKQEFAGYWEYLLKEAIFTAPAHPNWGGAGLIGNDGKLLGIGSLHVQQINQQGQPQDINMIVPIDLLPPILDDLLTFGRVNKPPRPWLGIYAMEKDGRIVIAGVTERGPAADGGLRQGDIVSAVRDSSLQSLADFYRVLWSSGAAGAEIPIEIVRDNRSVWLRVKSADRNDFLKKPSLH
jgi:S1-C subfamily serine protease